MIYSEQKQMKQCKLNQIERFVQFANQPIIAHDQVTVRNIKSRKVPVYSKTCGGMVI